LKKRSKGRRSRKRVKKRSLKRRVKKGKRGGGECWEGEE
jgi:hypothetical protein